MDNQDLTRCHFEFQFAEIACVGTAQAVEVALIDNIMFNQGVVVDSEVGQLLDGMRAKSSKSDDSHLGGGQLLLTFRPKRLI